jgi:phosphatidyl-myo-inositol dimannoside synthase
MNRNRKALLLAEVFPPEKGGIQTWAHQLAKNYQDEMIVVAPKRKGDKRFDKKQNYKVVRSGERPIKFEKFSQRLTRKVTHRINPKITLEIASAYQWLGIALKSRKQIRSIHVIHIRPAYLAYLFNKWFNIPYFIYGHGLELKKVLEEKEKQVFYSKLLKNAKKVFVNSEYTKNLVTKFGVNRKNIKEIPLGVNYQKFKPGLKTDFLRKRHNITKNDQVVFSLGRLVERKGFDVSLEAFAKVVQENDNLKYIIGGSGTEEKNLKELAKKLKIKDRVIFAGRIDEEELPSYFSLADVFLMPSRELKGGEVEGFGIVFLEAGACQVPVIGGNSGGIASAINDGETGYLVNPKDKEEIAQKLRKILNNPELADKMGEAGRKRVIEEYNWQNSVKIVKEIENKLLL